jgi:glycerol kinase
VTSHRGLLTTVAWQIPGELTYALEGSAFIAGAAVQWLRDGLGFFTSAKEVEALAASACPTRAASSWCRRSPAWAPRTGGPTRAASSPA